MSLLRSLVLTAISLWLLDFLLPNVGIATWWALAAATTALVIIDWIVKPVLNVVLLPLTIITLGLFKTLLTVGLFWLVTAIVPGFHIDPLWVADWRIGQWVMIIIMSFLLQLLIRLGKVVWHE